MLANHVVSIENGEKPYRILVVDDNKENLKVVADLLKLVGFETNEAVNGEDAVMKFEHWNPDLILMDLRMPVMDGYEATTRIKSTVYGAKIPIVALTASAFEEEHEKTKQLGLQGYLRKPFRENELFSTIGRILGVRYTYENQPPLPQTNDLYDKDTMINDIASLPQWLVIQMQEAIAVADLNQLIRHIHFIHQDYSELSRYLMIIAQNYDYDQLQKILNVNEHK